MISVIVPVLNEEETLEYSYGELVKELQKIREPFEIVFVDDGSTDSSLQLLKSLEKKDTRVRVYSLRKNLGKSEALTLGFHKASGNTIVTIDADLQDRPSGIAPLLSKQRKEKIDIVSGWRKDRKDASKMVIISRIFNTITGKMFDIHLHDYNCGLKVYTKDAAKSLRLYGGQHRFIPLLASQQGFTVDELPTEHEKRRFGKSKYGFSKVWKDLPDMFTMLFLAKYTKRPLHFFGPVGGLLSIIGIGILSYLSILWLGGESIGRRPLLIFGALFLISGIQIFFTGFLAELLINVSQKDNYHFPLRYSSDTK